MAQLFVEEVADCRGLKARRGRGHLRGGATVRLGCLLKAARLGLFVNFGHGILQLSPQLLNFIVLRMQHDADALLTAGVLPPELVNGAS